MVVVVMMANDAFIDEDGDGWLMMAVVMIRGLSHFSHIHLLYAYVIIMMCDYRGTLSVFHHDFLTSDILGWEFRPRKEV